jgi:hypothetical protein
MGLKFESFYFYGNFFCELETNRANNFKTLEPLFCSASLGAKFPSKSSDTRKKELL